jgi:hypothetical protein
MHVSLACAGALSARLELRAWVATGANECGRHSLHRRRSFPSRLFHRLQPQAYIGDTPSIYNRAHVGRWWAD